MNVQTIRYYERLNLLDPSTRRPSGYRLYGQEQERRLRFIKKAQALGFTLREIAELLALRVASSFCRSDIEEKAAKKLMQVKRKIDDLQILARVLKDLIRACRAGKSIGRCPILMSLEKETNADTKERTKG